VETDRTRFAKRLFESIAPEYDRMGSLLSFGQDPRWRRFLVSKINAIPGSWVLDVATGTGLVARELARKNVRVAGLDQSEPMVRKGVEAIREVGLEDRIRFLLAQAERLPFADETFDAVTFTYLLRYVDDPAATIAELARVLRPGGVMAELEFYVPQDPWARVGWKAYTRTLMPAAGTVVSRAWYQTGRFLGPNIEAFYNDYPLPVQVRMWQEAGLRRVHTKVMTMGVAIVTWGVKRSALTDE
jgi:demethylmenaquinone methyltransferase / 2-methoxy-6-polyprenyl-1,4-benzoquinol methylase